MRILIEKDPHEKSQVELTAKIDQQLKMTKIDLD